MKTNSQQVSRHLAYAKKPKPKVLEVTSDSQDEQLELKGLVETLRRGSIRTFDASGARVAFHILQTHEEVAGGYRLTFTPGVLESVSGEGEPLALLRFLATKALL